MDSEILGERLAATEEAVLQLDERIDAVGETETETPAEPILDHEGRIATLEERLNTCLATLSTLEARLTSQIQEAEQTAQIAEQTAEAALNVAEADLLAAEPEAAEEIATEGIAEVEPEPEEAANPASLPKWWESFLTLR